MPSVKVPLSRVVSRGQSDENGPRGSARSKSEPRGVKHLPTISIDADAFDPAPSLIFSQGRSGHRSFGRYFKVFCMVYTFCRSELLKSRTCLGLRASLAATCFHSIQLFDLEFTGFGTLLLGRCSKYPLRTLFCAVQMWCSGHRMDLLALSSTTTIMPTTITTPRSGAHSAWATVFGRLLSIVDGNIVLFTIREPAFASFSAHAQHILIRCTYILSSGDRFRHRPNLFRFVLRDLKFLQSSFCAQVHCFLCLGSISAHARWILIRRSYFSVTRARISDPFASISA